MKLTTLIIDDDLVSQFATRYCIQQSHGDFNIVTCSSGEEGIQACFSSVEESDRLPDIIFLDLVMDGMNGWEFLENLKNLFKEHELPSVYVLSAFTNSSDRAIAKDHGLIAGYVDKPLSRSYLEKILKKEEKKRTVG
ncbi:MAG: response regulator [Bacteroidota bacterium]|uniref:Response regulator n=1 Tax=Flagellimonas profundi TaxID=2915620 RepID=A0ABS3FIG7_9FLAO|nr:response regulator [Allomuricauda profundi]MBO0342326.1 response regulator [Allomuricauda profundi]MEC7772777.1 response regulator [Bacteroidota bacterium]